MAFNQQIFRRRAITAVVFVIIMLAGLLWNRWSFLLLFSVIHFGCWLEYQRLVARIDKEYDDISSFHRYGIMLAGWCLLLYFAGSTYTFLGFRLQELGWWTGLIFIFILPINELLFTRHIRLKNIGHSLFGLVYISLSLGLLMDLRTMDIGLESQNKLLGDGRVIPCGLIFSLWINDTMAYIVGSFIGKTPLSSISPKKTWEGTIGGGLLSIIIIPLLAWLARVNTVFDWVMISTIAVIAGTAGDLLESKMKRLANVKDSGTLMPGHGGFLDRFDSLLIAIPFVWLYVQIAMR